MATHSSLTGSDLHETKGADTASADTVHVADGSGATSWQKIAPANIASSVFNVNKDTLTVVVPTPTAAFTYYLAVPWDCTLNTVYGTVGGTPGSALDIDIYNDAGVLIDDIGFAVTAVAGDVDNFTANANNTFTAGETIRITSAGAAGTVSVVLTFTFTRTS
jgi:hypothetical protein